MPKSLRNYLVTTTHGSTEVKAKLMMVHEGCLLFSDLYGDELITVTAFAPHEWLFVVLDRAQHTGE